MNNGNKFNHLPYLLMIFSVSLIILLPQLISGNMILGSDSIFHFNRFYDTAEQIKNLNFQYHLSFYGFQQSGRIVNALYGPFLAYFHGFLVLISKNWFTYQVISNFILFNLAGLSMYVFILKSKLNQKSAFLGAVLYISTYSVQYWTIKQGFTSWGAALLPLALSLLFEVSETKRVPKFTLAIYTALMVQTHMLSSLILVLIYLPFFAEAFFHQRQKLSFVRDLLREVALFFCLTLNVWASYSFVLKDNQLVSPNINNSMSLNTINQNSYYWLLNPVTLILILLLVYLIFLRKWKQFDRKKKLWFFVMNGFLLLSTSIIPWDYLIEKQNPVAELIQFPFRFFVPVSIIAIYLGLMIVSSNTFLKKYKKILFLFCIGVSIIQSTILITDVIFDWNTADAFMPNQYKVVFAGDSETIKRSFYDENKQKALELVTKGTPDYLPIYQQDSSSQQNNYDLYLSKVVQNDKFKKSIKDNSLNIEWTASSEAYIELPVIIYKNTVITLNGKTFNHDQLKLSTIGTPTVPQVANGKNTVSISYKMGSGEKIMIIFSGLSWFILSIILLIKFTRKTLRNKD